MNCHCNYTLGALVVIATQFYSVNQALAQVPASAMKPIHMIISLAPGGGVDTTGRIIAQKLSEMWGQPVVADNKPGAGGSIAAEAVAHAAPDGNTILMTSADIAINPSVIKLTYDADKDLLPVTLAVFAPGVMVVHPSIPVKSVKELIAYGKSKPDELFYSSSGLGSAQHLAMALFTQMTGLKMTHVPYKGTAASITDLVGGRVAASVASVVSTRAMFTTGKLRALAVVGAKRTPALPDYPTIAEAGVPGFSVDQWYGLFLPGKTSKAFALKMQEAVSRIVLEPEMRKKLLAQGLDAVGSSQEEFAKAYSADMAKWAKVARTAGLKPD